MLPLGVSSLKDVRVAIGQLGVYCASKRKRTVAVLQVGLMAAAAASGATLSRLRTSVQNQPQCFSDRQAQFDRPREYRSLARFPGQYLGFYRPGGRFARRDFCSSTDSTTQRCQSLYPERGTTAAAWAKHSTAGRSDRTAHKAGRVSSAGSAKPGIIHRSIGARRVYNISREVGRYSLG